MKIEPTNLNWKEAHGFIGSVIAPLPIALISTIGQDGTHNAAPFSFITPVCSKPPIVCVSMGLRKGQKKDTLRNIEFSLDFVVNIVDEKLISQAIKASADYPSGVDEIKEVGLTVINSERVKSPRIAESKVSLECRLIHKFEILEERKEGAGLISIVFGQVVLAHIKDELLVDGMVEPSRLRVIGRVGNDTYCRTEDIFVIKRP